MMLPPHHAQILVVGGGPAGSYAASVLAREGFHVVLFEAAAFPRYHIGESLIPAVRHHLRFIGAEEKVANAGFAHKPGAAMKFTQHKHEGYTDFVALGASNSVWNVCRADFDALLLDHAREQGASVFQQTKVTGVAFDSQRRPTSATYIASTKPHASDGGNRTITFDYLIDATGRAGLLSTRYFKSRRFNTALRNTATWGYWKGADVYGQGSAAEGAPWFEALSDESGWAWFIPLAGDITSVGLVRSLQSSSPDLSVPSTPLPSPLSLQSPFMLSTPRSSVAPDSPHSLSFGINDVSSSPPTTPSSSSPTKRPSVNTPPRSTRRPSTHEIPMTPVSLKPSISSTKAGGIFSPGGSLNFAHQTPSREEPSSATRQRYLASLSLAPGLQALLGENAELIPGGSPSCKPDGGSQANVTFEDTTIRTTSDFSYSASSYAGPGYRIIGDAGAFIDPFFSSGVHLAMNSALSASASIAAAIRGDCDEKDASEWHTARVSVSYTRFLVVVLSAYKQMRAQNQDVLTDIGEDSFENAFKALRPVIHGNADVGPRLSEEEVQRALDFCSDLFTPTSPEQHAAARARLMDAENANRQAGDVEYLPSSIAAGGRTPPRPTARNRKRSGTIDRVWQWLRRSEADAVSGPTSSPSQPPLVARCLDTALALSPSRVDTLFDVRTPVLAPRTLDAAVATLLPAATVRGETEEEVRRVLGKINARRVIHRDFGGMHSLEEEVLGPGAGWRIRLQRGELGLTRAEPADNTSGAA